MKHISDDSQFALGLTYSNQMIAH